CAGGDVAVMEEHLDRRSLPKLFHELVAVQEAACREIVQMPKPVVAALPGVAAGGGLSLALAADWRIGVPATQLVPAFPRLGAIPDGGLTYFLPHFLGIGLAQEMLFTNAKIPAERARELGLLHELVAPERLAKRAEERARELAEGPTAAYGAMKHLLSSAYSSGLDTQMSLERRAAVEAASGEELPEGIRAFRAKRAPRFSAPGSSHRSDESKA
ncbi:MAG TPA: enoyl-CoA hydratase-related protein, partial [Thermoplasmata archaeon]|nr:enoyl-CoA hydratase-related protein [Thermoplasmata archaeon]